VGQHFFRRSRESHAFGSPTERAYRRSKLVEQRRKITDAWAEYCAG
jgi:hypothetical protein